jgi:MFS-type transporter involved in bile tolerance (Atg22 family)
MINEVSSVDQSKQLWKEKNFIYMLISYGIIMGAQCAIITLLAQILIPLFGEVIDEKYVGFFGAVMLFVGFPASIVVGYHLDQTLKYKSVCRILSVLTALSVLGFYISCEYEFLTGVIVSCLFFGLTSYGKLINTHTKNIVTDSYKSNCSCYISIRK